ncbi:MAG: sensor histidine kinase [Aestuariibacter sp.]
MIKPDWIEEFGSSRLSGVITIVVVASIALYLAAQQSFEPAVFVIACLLYAAQIVLFIQTTKEHMDLSEHWYLLLITLQLLLIYALFFTLPYTFNAILLGIWSGHLVYLMRLSHTLLVIPVLVFLYYCIFAYHWQDEYIIFGALLYSMLIFFTVVMVDAARKERDAKDESQQLYRELLAAQSLLREATKQSERVRIARNIHDLVGHHLTALTINLQVAMHKSEGEAKQQIEKSFAIAKLLLSDVREAVTEIREKSNIELRESLEALVAAVPRLQIDLQLDEQLSISDVDIADTVLKCVQESLTNSLKHGNSDHFCVRIFSAENKLTIEMQDNGKAKMSFLPGNGLKGMRERVEKLCGSVDFQVNHNGFFTRIELPTENTI